VETSASYYNQSFISPVNASRWYAVYTRPHHERKVCRNLEEIRIDAYLPLCTTLRQWSDRKKKVSVPLFSCYVFVHINPKDYFRVLGIPGIIRYVSFEGKAAAIPEKQIKLLKNILEQDIESEEVFDSFYKGAQVQIMAGPLTGITGELVSFLGKKRIVISIPELNKSIVLSVPVSYLKIMN
jgi:transcription antitermination factor NusG